MPNQNAKNTPLSEGPLDQETIDALTTPPEAMDDQEPEKATWWTPEKYLQAPKPPAFARLDESDESGDWDKILKAGGYDMETFYGGEFDPLQVRVHRHRDDRHLLVELWDVNVSLSTFFVSPEHRDAFFAMFYPQFLQAAALSMQADCLGQITKIFRAYVRHGHGPDTIDRNGSWDADDAADYRELKRQRSKDTSNTSNKHPYGNQN
jgi:hypothetical protein